MPDHACLPDWRSRAPRPTPLQGPGRRAGRVTAFPVAPGGAGQGAGFLFPALVWSLRGPGSAVSRAGRRGEGKGRRAGDRKEERLKKDPARWASASAREGAQARPAASPKLRAPAPGSDQAGSGPARPSLAGQPQPHARWQPFRSAYCSLCWAQRRRIPCLLPAFTAPHSGLPNWGAGPFTAVGLQQPHWGHEAGAWQEGGGSRPSLAQRSTCSPPKAA